MSAEMYQMISMAAFICGGIFTIAAVVLFIKFDIPAIIGELSGRTAEKKVQEIREQNRQAVTMRQRDSERRRRNLLYNAASADKAVSKPLQETKLMQGTETEVLDEQTVILDEQTVVLDEADDFCIVQDVVEVHTMETI